jgi:C4-dicarboxylate-specific signal transduction histidine kinase
MNAVPSSFRRRSTKPSGFFFKNGLLILAALALLVTATSFWELNSLQQELVKTLAEQGAKLQSDSLEELRSLYTSEVAEKLRESDIEITHEYLGKKGAIPLPASLTLELGRRLSGHGSDLSVRLYSNYPFPWRKDGGPRDAFERDALASLTRDPATPVVRFEQYHGQPAIRYAVADRMRESCVACHNSNPDSPKRDWKVGDVRGVLEVTRVIEPVAATAEHNLQAVFALMAAMAALGLLAVGSIINRQRRHMHELAQEVQRREKTERELRHNYAHLQACRDELEQRTIARKDGWAAAYVRMVQTALRWEATDLNVVLEESLELVGKDLISRAEITRDYAPLPPVDCVPSQLTQVFLNLIINALQAMDGGPGKLSLRTRADANEVSITVADNGCGIAATDLPHVFDPFFSTEPPRKGTGLGLPLAYGIVQAHQGHIEVESEASKGSSFCIVLPLHRVTVK